MNILKIMLFQLLIIIPFVLIGVLFISIEWVIVGVLFFLLGVVYSATFGVRYLEERERKDK